MEKSWKVIFCKFKDIPAIKQKPEVFEKFFTDIGKEGVFDFWNDVSYGLHKLSGAKIQLDFGPSRNWHEMKYSYIKDMDLPRGEWIKQAIDLTGIDTTKSHVMVVVNANVDAGAEGENMVVTIGVDFVIPSSMTRSRKLVN